jgi:hypothetical protein
MTTPAPVVDVASNTVTVGAISYAIQALSDDTFTVLVAGVPVGRIVRRRERRSRRRLDERRDLERDRRGVVRGDLIAPPTRSASPS